MQQEDQPIIFKNTQIISDRKRIDALDIASKHKTSYYLNSYFVRKM